MVKIYAAFIAGFFSILYLIINWLLTKQKQDKEIELKRFGLYKEIYFEFSKIELGTEEEINFVKNVIKELIEDPKRYFLYDPNTRRYLANCLQYSRMNTKLGKKLYKVNVKNLRSIVYKETINISKYLKYPNYDFRSKISKVSLFLLLLSLFYLLDNPFSETYPEYEGLSYIIFAAISLFCVPIFFIFRKYFLLNILTKDVIEDYYSLESRKEK